MENQHVVAGRKKPMISRRCGEIKNNQCIQMFSVFSYIFTYHLLVLNVMKHVPMCLELSRLRMLSWVDSNSFVVV